MIVTSAPRRPYTRPSRARRSARDRRTSHWPSPVESMSVMTAIAFLLWSAWTQATLSSRVEQDLKETHASSSAQWTALVETGMSPDSATDFVLSDIRARFAGRSRPQMNTSFVADVDLEAAWKARMLSPFHETELTMPRGDNEAQFLLDTRIDVRNALAAGRPTLRAAREQQSIRRLWVALAFAVVIVGGVMVRVTRRRRALADAHH